MRGDGTWKGGKESAGGRDSPITGMESVPGKHPSETSSPVLKSGFVIGLSGPLGSGKSSLCALLVAKGAESVSGDEVGHDVLDEEPTVRSRLVEAFGGDILDVRGHIDRRALAERAFHSETALGRLNQVVHPLLVARLRERIARHRSKGKGILVVDAALIPEWGMEPEVDVLVHVTAPRDDRVRRWCEARGCTTEDFGRREQGQLPEDLKIRNAHVVVHNDMDRKELPKKAGILWDLLTKIQLGQSRLTERVEL
jgi:dephospho-CoA kinase